MNTFEPPSEANLHVGNPLPHNRLMCVSDEPAEHYQLKIIVKCYIKDSSNEDFSILRVFNRVHKQTEKNIF